MYRHILLATDLTPASAPAERTAAALAVALGARVTALHVCQPSPVALAATPYAGADTVGPCLEGVEEEMGRLVGRLRAASVEAEGTVTHGSPWSRIVETAAAKGADLVVLGTHGRHGLAHAVLGSVAEKVVQEIPVPVLVVPAPARP